ncbi:glycosyltransferase [Amycolatopsis rubida]|uniref:Glycosyltransferase involved in cell wall bisynthesis n=1 Tax=Amycolatopsis rubida TaxID=112413 RepID=A0A1I5KHX0_9PSEU|nr:glycosyltransferase [Amycolatopsis rubida]SFO84615.1 Glycosyltransferase involved in cell wall bisynthesis [Amycolatopsis rubida]
MKIAMVSEHAGPLDGNSEHVAALSAALAGCGHDVTVCTRRDSRSAPDEVTTAAGYRVRYLRAGPPCPVPSDELLPHLGEFASRLRGEWALRRPDVVHAHFWTACLAAALAANEHGIPVVQTFRTLGIVQRRCQGRAYPGPPDRIRLERMLGRRAHRVVAACSAEMSELVRQGVPRHRMTVVRSGVDLSPFRTDGTTAERFAPPRLLAVGRWAPRDGLDLAIAALPLVPGTELVIAGDPAAPALGPEVRRLHGLAARLGVAGRVRLAGQVAREDLPVLMRSADAVVCTPWYESFGVAALEAMACGVPVVATAVGVLADAVVDDVTGRLVQPGSPEKLAACLRALLAEPAWLHSLGVAGRDRARVCYSWDRVAAETLQAYEHAVSASELSQAAAQ